MEEGGGGDAEGGEGWVSVGVGKEVSSAFVTNVGVCVSVGSGRFLMKRGRERPQSLFFMDCLPLIIMVIHAISYSQCERWQCD